jgi:hypothetical protein
MKGSASDSPDVPSGLVIKDIGGRAVQGGGRFSRGVLYRISGDLIGPAEFAALDGMALDLLVDLRGPDENRSALDAWAAARGVSYRHAPIAVGRPTEYASALRGVASFSEADAAGLLWEIYQRIIDEHGRTFVQAIKAINEALPAGFGCAAGKDRAGILAALIQSVVGVHQAEIVEDYVGLAPEPERLRAMLREQAWSADVDLHSSGLTTLLSATAETMTALLAYLTRKWGGPSAYLHAHGLDPASVDRLRHQLVEL